MSNEHDLAQELMDSRSECRELSCWLYASVHSREEICPECVQDIATHSDGCRYLDWEHRYELSLRTPVITVKVDSMLSDDDVNRIKDALGRFLGHMTQPGQVGRLDVKYEDGD